MSAVAARVVHVRGDQRLHVEEQGQGPPLVLVHGLPGRGSDFAPLTARLAPSLHCIRYDRAGYARSAPNTRPAETGLAQSSADLLALLDGLGVERASLLGWSYGGPIVLEAAARMPARVARIVLVCSAGPAFAWRGATNRLLFQTPLGGPILRGLLRLGRWPFRRALDVAYGEPAPAALLDSFVDGIAAPGAIAQWIGEGCRFEPRATRTDGTAPCLVIHGTRDAQVDVAVGEALAADLPRATLWRVPDAGHWPFATHAEAVAARVLAFLSEDGAGWESGEARG